MEVAGREQIEYYSQKFAMRRSRAVRLEMDLRSQVGRRGLFDIGPFIADIRD